MWLYVTEIPNRGLNTQDSLYYIKESKKLECKLGMEAPEIHQATREAQEYWSGYLPLLQGIFPTQELNWGLP